MSLQGTVCVKFTPKQYMKLYECGLLYYNYNKLNTTASVVQSLVDTVQSTWLGSRGFTNTTTNGPSRGLPNHKDCKL